MIFNILEDYSFLKWIGLVIVIINALKLSKFILRRLYFYVKDFCGFTPWKNLGKWAVVTGGSDGIGRAYADELASKGFNVCLISRNVEKLNYATKEIAEKYRVSTKTIIADFTDGPKIYTRIKSELQELDGEIGILVNNVGMSYKYAEYFHLVPDGPKFLWDMINCNITSSTMMMRLVMPMMKGKGIVINISSLIAIYPMPMLSLYAACKAYVEYLSRATQSEYKDKGIRIQCVLPAYVATKMSNRKISLEIPSAKIFVSSAVKTIGIEDYTYGYFPHKIRGFVHQWLKANMPPCFNLALSLYVMKKNKESYLRKMKRRKMEELKKATEASQLENKTQ